MRNTEDLGITTLDNLILAVADQSSGSNDKGWWALTSSIQDN